MKKIITIIALFFIAIMNIQSQVSVTITNHSDVSCFGFNDGWAKATASGSSGTYIYKWNTNPIQTTDSVVNLFYGTYTVTVTDFYNNQDSSTASITITQPSQIILTGVFSNSNCGQSDGSIYIDVASGTTPPYTYLWNTGSSTQDLNTIPAGSYTITVTDGNNCYASFTYQIDNIPGPTAIISAFQNVTCFEANDGFATVVAYGGSQQFSYVWNTNPVQYSTSILNLSSGVYQVTITDILTFCITTTNVTITQPPLLQVSTISHDETCYMMCDGYIASTVTGGQQPYTYLWSNFEINSTLDSLCPDIYTVTVTDYNNCSVHTNDTVFGYYPLDIMLVNIDSATCSQNNGVAEINVMGGANNYTYIWSNSITSTSNIATNLSSGHYMVTVIDGNACFDSLYFDIFSSSFSVNLTGKPIICYDELDTIIVNSGCGNYPLTYSWNQGIDADSFIVVSPTVNTLYTVTITDALNQISIDSFLVTVNPHCGNIISGYVFIDLNENGIKDNNESGIANKLIKITPGPSYAITDSMGFYISHDAGMYNYSISIPNPGYFTLIPTSNVVVFTTLGNTDSLNNFAFQPIPVNDLSISVIDIAAHPGFNYNVTINCFNNGADTLNTILQLKIPNLLNYQSSLPNISFQNNDTLIWNINNFLPHSYITFYANFNIPTNILIGDTILLKAIILPVSSDTLLSNNTFNLTRIVTGSYDPNYKSVTPDKYISLLQVQQRKPLYYTIHFQNTGTDTAYTVRVTDTVSTNLDIESFEMLFASHSYSVQIKNNNILEWKFENILLPDSNINEPLSHGFVHFSLIPREDLLVNDIILNSSNIYFDFNTPVLTNTVADTVCETLTQIKNSNNTSDNMVMVYPNPFNDKTNIILNLDKQSLTEINLFSAMGQKIKFIYKGVLLQGLNKIILNNNFNLTKGFYLLEVKTETQVYYQKLYIY